jgi:IS5 family transposase
MEEAFIDTPRYREFAQFEEFARLPEESTILRIGKTPQVHAIGWRNTNWLSKSWRPSTT